MIVGNPSIFAVESGVTHAYERLGFRALGFFVLHIGGHRYGVCKPDATMLACSFDEVEQRIARRGTHVSPFATELDGRKIADTFRLFLYAPNQEKECFHGMPQPKLYELVCANKLEWAPDGDEAFDDGSYVYHFDVQDRVRLIAFMAHAGYGYESTTFRDVWLDADDFYRILQQWHDAFEAQWAAMLKTPEDEPIKSAGS